MKTYVGLDISKKQTVAVWKNKEGEKVSEETFTTDREGLARLVKKIKRSTEVALEASTSGVFVYDYLQENNVKAIVGNPILTKLISHSDKKTDKIDAEKLADLLRMNMLPTCYMPDKKTREMRDVIKHRRALVETNTVLKNKIRAILTREGLSCPYATVLGEKSLKWLNDTEIGQVQKTAILKFVGVALMIENEIREYNIEIYHEHQSNKEAQLLTTIPGISYYSAVHIMSAIGDIKRFPSDEELASYAGLVPKLYQSGEVRYHKGLKHGDGQLKSILVQDANAAIRCSKRLRKYYLKKKRKKCHQKALIAVARKMTEIIYCMLTRGETYQESYE